MPERGWAIACGLAAIVPILALWLQLFLVRLIALVLHVMLWSFVATMFTVATPLGLGGPIYLILFAGGGFWAAMRIAFEHKESILEEWGDTIRRRR